jgi:arabinose-5-phosphate isomerase
MTINNDILLYAKQILLLESDSISCFANSFLNTTFIEVVNLISSSKGKIVISGVGKSGHVGQKISATFASLGICSVFVHATEASHGDLGVLQNSDILILLSNSGETAELREIMHYAKTNKISIVCIVNNSSSFIAKNSDFVISMNISSEALDDLPAPTTSSTLTLAIGDAIAGCVVKKRGFARNDYSKLHPGGKLGFALQPVMNVARGIEKTPLLHSSSSIKDAILEITTKGCGVVGVLDDKNVLIGTISDGDLRRHIDTIKFDDSVFSIMNHSPISVNYDLLVEDVISILHHNKILSVFVMKDGFVIGIVQLYDVI